MTYQKREYTERYVSELEAALDSLSTYGKQVDGFDLATEMLLLLRGTTEEVLDFWKKAPRKYLDDEVADYARRDVVMRYDRADLLEMMDSHCNACWALEDVLKIPLGPSKLRKSLIVKPRDYLVPNYDSALVARGDIEVHRLALAVACADLEAISAVEATDWIRAESTPAQWAQARMNGAVACWTRRSNEDAVSRLDLMQFISKQWHQALAEGADPNLASFDGNALRRIAHDSKSTPLDGLAESARNLSPLSAHSKHNGALLDLVRDMIWSEGGVKAQKAWCFTLSFNEAARKIPPKKGWPICLEGEDAMDPFLTVLSEEHKFAVLDVVAKQAEVSTEHAVSDERLRRWVDGLADLMSVTQQKHSWRQRCQELCEWLQQPCGAPLDWMNPEQQVRWHTFRDHMVRAMTNMLKVWDKGQEDIAKNLINKTDFLESPQWLEVILEANFSRQWGDIQRPTAGPKPRF